MSDQPSLLPWQAEVMRLALRLQREGRLPHAVLLETPSERGIDELARYLAQLLLCEAVEDVAVCGACEACRMMAAGTYADFSRVTLEFDEKNKKFRKNITIEQIRDLIHELSLTRKYQRPKIAVIYPADAMNKNAANALLKTLEEPAAHVLLVLLTRNPGRVPITLRSRCQAWSIHPPAEQQSLEWLKGRGLDEGSASQYLQYAAGDPLLAEHLQQQDFAGIVDGFRSRLGAFLRGALGIGELSKGLLDGEVALSRRLIEMTLAGYCMQACGVDFENPAKQGPDRGRARELLDLRARAQRQLQVEENNLDFQIQLEDVLISLKQILTRRMN